MDKFHFGGKEFVNCSVPLAFEGHYFIVERTPALYVSVIYLNKGQPCFEILRNDIVGEPPPTVDMHEEPAGTITAHEPGTKRLLYRIHLGQEIKIELGTTGGIQISAYIGDHFHLSRVINTANPEPVFSSGIDAVTIVYKDGKVDTGGMIPPELRLPASD